MDFKGQGALEYLLIIGGAIMVAAIVIALMMGASNPTKEATTKNILDGLCAKFSTSDTCNDGVPATGCDNCCTWQSGICKAENAWPTTCMGGSSSPAACNPAS